MIRRKITRKYCSWVDVTVKAVVDAVSVGVGFTNTPSAVSQFNSIIFLFIFHSQSISFHLCFNFWAAFLLFCCSRRRRGSDFKVAPRIIFLCDVFLFLNDKTADVCIFIWRCRTHVCASRSHVEPVFLRWFEGEVVNDGKCWTPLRAFENWSLHYPPHQHAIFTSCERVRLRFAVDRQQTSSECANLAVKPEILVFLKFIFRYHVDAPKTFLFLICLLNRLLRFFFPGQNILKFNQQRKFFINKQPEAIQKASTSFRFFCLALPSFLHCFAPLVPPKFSSFVTDSDSFCSEFMQFELCQRLQLGQWPSEKFSFSYDGDMKLLF